MLGYVRLFLVIYVCSCYAVLFPVKTGYNRLVQVR
jgi:hypothetical protein